MHDRSHHQKCTHSTPLHTCMLLFFTWNTLGKSTTTSYCNYKLSRRVYEAHAVILARCSESMCFTAAPTMTHLHLALNMPCSTHTKTTRNFPMHKTCTKITIQHILKAAAQKDRLHPAQLPAQCAAIAGTLAPPHDAVHNTTIFEHKIAFLLHVHKR